MMRIPKICALETRSPSKQYERIVTSIPLQIIMFKPMPWLILACYAAFIAIMTATETVNSAIPPPIRAMNWPQLNSDLFVEVTLSHGNWKLVPSL